MKFTFVSYKEKCIINNSQKGYSYLIWLFYIQLVTGARLIIVAFLIRKKV